MRNAVSIASLLLAGCGGLLGEPAQEEVAWAAAPDRLTHATLLETNGGATTSFGYVVELHSTNHPDKTPVNAGSLYGAIRNDCAYGVDLQWLNSSTLALRYKSAKHINVPKSVVVDGRRIHLVTQGGQVNTKAPCGGMAAVGRSLTTPSRHP